MKKFLFSLTMLVAVALAGFTTSCSNNNDGGDDDKANAKVYSSSLNVQTGTPDEIQQGGGVDLGTITEDVKIEMNSSANTLNLSIKGINLGELANIPAPLQAPFDIELNNVPIMKLEWNLYKKVALTYGKKNVVSPFLEHLYYIKWNGRAVFFVAVEYGLGHYHIFKTSEKTKQKLSLKIK